MTARILVLNPVEPALLSVRAALGVNLDLAITFLRQDQVPVDPDTLIPQLAIMPRSAYGIYAYDVDTTSSAQGTASVSIPGTALVDPAGFNLELYQRRVADNPDDPPVPVGLLAKGVLRLEGSAYFAWGPLAPINVPVVVGPVGPQGVQGETGPANILSIGIVDTGAPGDPAQVTIDGLSPSQVLNFSLPQGDVGPANILAIGTVTTGAPGSPADASITGTSPSQTLNLTIPEGDQGQTGPANVLTVGTVTTGAPGSAVVVTITGTSPAQVVNFTIPAGLTGATGSNITLGTVLPGAATDGALFWNTSTNTLYVREAGAWVPVEATWGA